MSSNPSKKRIFLFSTLLILAVLVVISSIIVNTTRVSAPSSTTLQLKPPKQRVSVHDPTIVKDTKTKTYYVFGTHIEAAKSKDLMNWTKFTNSYTTPGNVIFGDLSKNLAGSFAWAGENDGDNLGGYAVWAPDVFWNPDYINKDGSKGAYMMYYCTSSTYKRSDIGYAVSKNIEGPYTYVNTIVYSGFTNKDNYDGTGNTMNSSPTDYSKVNTNYKNTNIQKLIDNHTLSSVNSNWFNFDGSYNNTLYPNALDPGLFYDKNGKLWMVYGSWSGGIFELQINNATGKAIYPGKDDSNNGLVDGYFGKKIAGGYGQSGEGPYVVYDKAAHYYYLYVTYGGLAANGGYNMRLFRSKNPDGPYLDAVGQNAVLPANTDNSAYGVKLMGNYKFSSMGVGYKSPGHNSSLIDNNGQMYLVYHTRFNSGTEYYEVRVHQEFINKDGWPVVAPYEYSGDHISQTGYSIDDIVGTYEFINMGLLYDGNMLRTLKVNLNKDHTVSGDIKGTWSMTQGTYYMQLKYKGVTYKGVFLKQQDESKYRSKVMTFSALGSNNEVIWGSKK